MVKLEKIVAFIPFLLAKERRATNVVLRFPLHQYAQTTINTLMVVKKESTRFNLSNTSHIGIIRANLTYTQIQAAKS